MWDEGQLTELARVSESDRQQAAAAARRYMTGHYKPMLDETADEGSDWEWALLLLLGMYLWRGRPVDGNAITGQLGRVMTGLEGEARAVSQNRELSTEEWALQMAQLSKASLLAAAAFFAGGWAFIEEMIAAVEGAALVELEYLNAFADDVVAGRVPKDGRFARRALLYAGAGFGLYMLLRGRRANERSYHEEMSVLDPGAEHCNGCVEEAGKGWQPIGTLTPIGDRQCRSNCRCAMMYRNRAGEVA